MDAVLEKNLTICLEAEKFPFRPRLRAWRWNFVFSNLGYTSALSDLQYILLTPASWEVSWWHLYMYLEVNEVSLRQSNFDRCWRLNVVLKKDELKSVAIGSAKSTFSLYTKFKELIKWEKSLLIYVSLCPKQLIFPALGPIFKYRIFRAQENGTYCH